MLIDIVNLEGTIDACNIHAQIRSRRGMASKGRYHRHQAIARTQHLTDQSLVKNLRNVGVLHTSEFAHVCDSLFSASTNVYLKLPRSKS